MPRLYCDANPRMIAYYIDGGGCNSYTLPPGFTSMEAEYMAIMYGLGEYFLKWNKELDAKHSELDVERLIATGEVEFANVASPSDRTKRQLPPGVIVCSDNEVVVKQLSRQYHIANDRLRKLAMRVWQMTKNVEVVYEWISRKDNLAGMMLK